MSVLLMSASYGKGMSRPVSRPVGRTASCTASRGKGAGHKRSDYLLQCGVIIDTMALYKTAIS